MDPDLAFAFDPMEMALLVCPDAGAKSADAPITTFPSPCANSPLKARYPIATLPFEWLRTPALNPI